MDGSGRVAVVTGAGSGIGRAVSIALLEAGYRVVCAGRREEGLRSTLAGYESQGLAVPTDVRREEMVQDLFRHTVEEFGRVDVLFNNAGAFGVPASVADLSLEDWQFVIDTNLTGYFLCAREAFRVMKQQQPRGGRIINNASVAAQVPRPHSVAYTAGKTGVTGLTKTISLEGRAYDIACGQIDIGNAATDPTDAFGKGTLQADGSMKAEPRMDVRHVCDAVLFMAGLPLDANVQAMTVMATKMPLVGRG